MKQIAPSLLTALLVVAPSFSFGSSALDNSGNYWLRACQEKAGEFGSAACLGYVAGVGKGYIAGAASGWMLAMAVTKADDKVAYGTRVTSHCLPEGATLGQVRDVFVAFLRRHPERRHEQAEWLFLDAMAEAFPCDSKR